MRNKFTSDLFKRGLISFAAASVLATTGFGAAGTYEGSVQDFRITMDKTTIEKADGSVNVVIELLDENGKVDILSTDTANLTVNSILGKVLEDDGVSADSTSTTGDKGTFGDVDTTNETNKIDFSNGKAGFSIYYPESAKIGTDTVRFTLTVADADDGGDASMVFPSVDKTINVTNPSNQAMGLEIVSLETISGDCTKGGCDKSDYATDMNATEFTGANGASAEGSVVAGEAFSVKIIAIKDADIADPNSLITLNKQYDVNATTFQNSTVTLEFKDENDENTTIYSTTDAMVEGVAFLNIPEEALTASKLYNMYAYTTTTVNTGETNSAGAYIADSNASYKVYVTPSTATSIKPVLSTNSEYNQLSTSETGQDANASISLSLADDYGNIVTSVTELADSIVTVSLSSNIDDTNVFTSSTSTASATQSVTDDAFDLTFNATDLSFDINVSEIASPTGEVDGVASGSVSFASSALTVLTDSITIPVYTKDLNVTWNDINASLIAGNLYEGFIDVNDSADTTIVISNPVTIDLLDADGEVLTSSTAYPDAGSVAVRFTLALTSSQIDTVRVSTEGYPSKEQNVTSSYGDDANTAAVMEINASVAAGLGVYKVVDDEATSRASKYLEVDSLATDLLYDSNITIKTDTTYNTEFDSENPNYVILLTDVYGNPISSGATGAGKVIVDTDSGNLSPTLFDTTTGEITSTTPPTLIVEDANEANATYVSIGVDNLTFTSTVPGINPITLPVTVTDSTPKLDSVQIVAGSDYLLTNGEMAVTVKALNGAGNGFDIGSDNFSVIISNPNLVTLRDGNRSNGEFIYDNGDFLDCSLAGSSCSADSDSIALSLTASNTVGDVDVTIRNTTGTISATKTLHVVSSTAEIVGAVNNVTATSTISEVPKGASLDVTFTVTDADGAPLANKTLQILSDNSGIIAIDKIETTDENGEVTVTLTTTAVGSVSISATSEGKSGVYLINVVEALALTLSSADVTIGESAQETITVTNPARDLTSDDITNTDETVVTASLVDGNIVLTSMAVGTATITVTDGTTTSTISVTVEAGVVTVEGTTADITDLGQTADETKLNIALKNADVEQNADGSLTVAGKMTVTITDTGITVAAVQDGYTVSTVEVKDGTAPTARAVETETEYIQIADDKYLEVTLEKADTTSTSKTSALVEGWNLLGNASNNTQTISRDGVSITWTYADGAGWTQDAPVPPSQGFWAKADAAADGYEFANDGDGTDAPTFTVGSWSLMSSTAEQTLADVLTANDGSTVAWTFIDSVWSNATEAGDTALEIGRGYWVK